MHRPLVSAFAATFATLLFYPMDCLKSAKQLNPSCRFRDLQSPYAGVWTDLCGTFGGTGLYFSVYERMIQASLLPTSLECLKPAIASSSAIAISTVLTTPTSVYTKRVQNRFNQRVKMKRLTPRSLLNVCGVSVMRNVPKAVTKFTIYESIVRINVPIPAGVLGMLAACVATLTCALLFTPLDFVRTHTSIHSDFNASTPLREMYRGCKYAVLHSMLVNSFVHSITEFASPRRG
jgi:hypothetical protein